jgi:hypothetical protein
MIIVGSFDGDCACFSPGTATLMAMPPSSEHFRAAQNAVQFASNRLSIPTGRSNPK